MLRCISKLKDVKTGKIVGYILADNCRNTWTLGSNDLKRKILYRDIDVDNLKLTLDNRLVDVKGGQIKTKKISSDEAYTIENFDWMLTIFEDSPFMFEIVPGGQLSVYEIGCIEGTSLAFNLLRGPKAEYYSSNCKNLNSFVYSRPLSIIATGNMRESIVTFTLGSNGETMPKYSKTVKVDTERGFTDFKQLSEIVDWFHYNYNNDNTQFRKNITSSYVESIEAKKRHK